LTGRAHCVGQLEREISSAAPEVNDNIPVFEVQGLDNLKRTLPVIPLRFNSLQPLQRTDALKGNACQPYTHEHHHENKGRPQKVKNAFEQLVHLR
jgi:hypothetical protein